MAADPHMLSSDAAGRAAASAEAPPRCHHSQPTNTNETATHTSDQTVASRIDTLCAPCLFMARKSTSSATRTNAANSDHISGVPIEIMQFL